MVKRKKEHGLMVGIFIFIALLILVVGIFTIGGKEGYFSENIIIKAYFETIEGIKRGAPVRLSGVDVGVITDISITGDNKVELLLKIDNEYQRFIRKNSQASIELEGIVGVKYVAITYGTQDVEIISNGNTIQSKSPFSLGKILQGAQSSMDNFQKLTEDLAKVFNKVNKGSGTLGKLVNDEKMYNVLLSASLYVDTTIRDAAKQLNAMSGEYTKLTGAVDKIVKGADSVVYNINRIIKDVTAKEGTVWSLFKSRDVYDSLQIVIQNSIETVREAKLGASRFAENMEALKHNFLFRGYFEDRGYWDKSQFEKQLDAKIDEIKKGEAELRRKEKELLQKEEELKIKKTGGN